MKTTVNTVAYELGKKAYLEGKSSAPCQNKECMDLLEVPNKSHDSNQIIIILKSFSKGWNEECAKALASFPG